MYVPTSHPILKLPTSEQAAEMGPEKWIEAMTAREKLIEKEKSDPLTFGWEPPIWKICDHLLGWPWVDKEEAAVTRSKLGFDKPVEVLLINGGNRAGKSEYAAKRTMMMLQRIDKARAWCFHESNQNSVEYQHPLMWKYLPPSQRTKVRSEVCYISYNQKYGFSDSKFVLPNASECIFRNYEQDREKIEGGELNIAWCDELIPPDWVETLELRLTTRAPMAKMLITFTPVKGYSPTCKLFQDGAEETRDSVAFLCPKDEGAALPDLALEMENCEKWSNGGGSQVPTPDGRKFESTPRVLRCSDGGQRAVVFFHSSDNPYGNPAAVLDVIKGKPRWFVRERFYGQANKTMATRFPKFTPKVHCLEADQVPKEGTNVMICDPSNARNFYIVWFRVTKDAMYAYREWPGSYEIPEVGVPGPWAVPDGKKPAGRPGPGQDPFGFGLWKMKREFARLEGWDDYGNFAETRKSDPTKLENEIVNEWNEGNGAKEKVAERYIDSRAASSPRIENDRPVTLLTEFEEIGIYFKCTPGDVIADGVAKINDVLDYDEEQPVSYLNSPRFFVSRACKNLIFSLQNWTGKDGTRGACKDPIDVLRYFVLSDCEDMEEGTWETEGGGHY